MITHVEECCHDDLYSRLDDCLLLRLTRGFGICRSLPQTISLLPSMRQSSQTAPSCTSLRACAAPWRFPPTSGTFNAHLNCWSSSQGVVDLYCLHASQTLGAACLQILDEMLPSCQSSTSFMLWHCRPPPPPPPPPSSFPPFALVTNIPAHD